LTKRVTTPDFFRGDVALHESSGFRFLAGSEAGQRFRQRATSAEP
jgi:hypothetical protein